MSAFTRITDWFAPNPPLPAVPNIRQPAIGGRSLSREVFYGNILQSVGIYEQLWVENCSLSRSLDIQAAINEANWDYRQLWRWTGEGLQVNVARESIWVRLRRLVRCIKVAI